MRPYSFCFGLHPNNAPILPNKFLFTPPLGPFTFPYVSATTATLVPRPRHPFFSTDAGMPVWDLNQFFTVCVLCSWPFDRCCYDFRRVAVVRCLIPRYIGYGLRTFFPRSFLPPSPKVGQVSIVSYVIDWVSYCLPRHLLLYLIFFFKGHPLFPVLMFLCYFLDGCFRSFRTRLEFFLLLCGNGRPPGSSHAKLGKTNSAPPPILHSPFTYDLPPPTTLSGWRTLN